MRSTSLGNQRANRRSHRNGAVCRFLAALGASVILGFGVGAPIAAAQSVSHVPLHDGGGDASRADQNGHLRQRFERLFEQVRAEHRERDHGGMQGQSTPAVNPPVVASQPPVTVPPVNPPNVIGSAPATPSAAAASARLNSPPAGRRRSFQWQRRRARRRSVPSWYPPHRARRRRRCPGTRSRGRCVRLVPTVRSLRSPPRSWRF